MGTWKKKLAAGVATLAMAVSMLPAIAMAAVTADTTITVQGVDSGDTAAYYQVVQQNSTTKAWELTTAFASLDLTQTETNAAENTQREADGLAPKTTIDFIIDGISAEEAGLIAALASGAGTTMTNYTATVDPGMYLILVTPANDNKDVVYKPIIVSADFDQTTSSPNSINVSTESLGAPVVVTAKKSPLTLTKTASTTDGKPDGVAVGDTVSFTVTSNVPTYSSNFTDPVYKITDVLSDGLTMTTAQQEGITVAVAGYNDLAKGTDYTITGTSASGDTVTFTESFLKRVTGNPEVTITYSATVTSDAAKQVNEMDNTVTLNFSNTPTDTEGHGELTDKTSHYTFDIDGAVFGSGSGSTKEVEKVGVDANGNIIETITSTSYPDGLPTGESPLADATFELRTNATDASTAIKFTNGVRDNTNGTTTLTSNADGSIVMKGLDEGTYYLVETAAPNGYYPDPNPRTITIAATYVDDADGNKVLSSYTITISDGTNTTTSTYTAGTDATSGKPIELTNAFATITADTNNKTSLIVNRKPAVLPSTGGSGIYFYIIVGGAIAGAAAYFITKTKKEEKQLS